LAIRQPLALFLVALALISFPLHLAWEWLQCQPYFVHGAAPATTVSMLIATLGDMALTFLAYCGVAAIYGASWPHRPWSAGVWFTLLGMALILSVAVEAYALQAGRWAYTDAAPRLPGTSMSALPIAQLLILFPLSFYFARALTRQVAPGHASHARHGEPADPQPPKS
jgi:hypothetical protein